LNLRLPCVIALVALALAGCGGSTKTVTVATSAPPTTTTTTTSSSATTTTASGPPPCADAVKSTNVRPVVCSTPNGEFTKLATENYPIRLKTLTGEFVSARTASSLSDSTGVNTATANGTFLIISVKITNNTTSPQTVESIGGNAFSLSTIGTNAKQYTESFKAENGPDQNSFVSQNSAPIQPDASQTADAVFDVPPPGLAAMRAHGAALAFGDFGVDVNSTDMTNNQGDPFALMIIHHAKLQG
jgi:hypothetical protein